MQSTISAMALALALMLVILGARAASILPSEYAFAIGNWLVRPSSLPFELAPRMATIARDTLVLKVAMPVLVGLVTYLVGRVLYSPRHDSDPHASLLAGAFAGAFVAGLILAWPIMSEWAALSPPAYAPHKPVFVGVTVAQIIALGFLARLGAGLASLVFYPHTEEAHVQRFFGRVRSAGLDLLFGTILITASAAITSAFLPL